MEDIYIEPDYGQQAKMEIDDFGHQAFFAYKYGEPIILGQVKVRVLEYEELEPLSYTEGHRARVVVERVLSN